MAVVTPLIDESKVIESFGVTAPLSLACATPRDEAETRAMLAYLESVAPAESAEGWRTRWEALVDLEQKVCDWLVSECSVDPITDDVHAVGKVLTFGSFRLGVIRPSSDIDTLVLIPSSVSRDFFFTDFISRVLSSDPEVTECVPVTDARVPIAKLKYRGIYFDILVASVPASEITIAMDCVDESLIYKVDEKCMKSMNGIRVAEKILTLVPDPATFRQATRLVKYWAQQRGIYSNSVGFFGGVSWSMAVARVCQLFPNFSAKQIVERFFYTFSNWPWEDNRPIMLCHPSRSSQQHHQFKDWNPTRYASDRNQVMPVVTPIFPSHNTTYNVTETQKQIMISELKRGKEIMQLMALDNIGWHSLCVPLPFFSLYNTFIELSVSAQSPEELAKFKGLVESRIRSLVRCIEMLDKKVIARPNPEFFPKSDSGSFYIGITVEDPEIGQIDLAPALTQFINETMDKSVAEWIVSEGIEVQNIRLEIRLETRNSVEENWSKLDR